LTVDDNGVLRTSPIYTHIGLAVAALLDYSTFIDFTAGGGASAEYGIIVDAYCGSLTSTPDNVIRLNKSRGVSLYAHTSDETGMIWYRGKADPIQTRYSQLWLNNAFVPILLHGVLSLCFGAHGDGYDATKARLMDAIFRAECRTVKEIFSSRWA
jgi:hypothetical protein